MTMASERAVTVSSVPSAGAGGPPALPLPKILELGRLCLQLGRVTRATYHEDGRRPETDTDHSLMLSVVACTVAELVAPHLDRGLIVQFCVVHDFPEVHAGDTVTLGIDRAAAVSKAEREEAAVQKLEADFAGLWLPRLIRRYESMVDPEARFVRVLDKCMPAITHLLNGGATFRALGLDIAAVQRACAEQQSKLEASYGADQAEAMKLLAALHSMLGLVS